MDELRPQIESYGNEPRYEDRGELHAVRGHENLRTEETEMPISSGNRIRDVYIRQLNYGYIVKIGCHQFAIETPDKLIEKLGEYIKSPQETEKRWFNGELL